jgi:hypothetical protein
MIKVEQFKLIFISGLFLASQNIPSAFCSDTNFQYDCGDGTCAANYYECNYPILCGKRKRCSEFLKYSYEIVFCGRANERYHLNLKRAT